MAKIVVINERRTIADDLTKDLTDMYFMKIVEKSNARNDPAAFSFELFPVQTMHVFEYRAWIADKSAMLVRINGREENNNA